MIYLDHNATTPVADDVLEAMHPYLAAHFANPAASYRAAYEARQAVEAARKAVAALLGSKPANWIFTSGATEALALAIGGLAHAQPARRHLVLSALEHPAVREPCRFLQALGYEVEFVPATQSGVVTAEAVARAVRPKETLLVALMHANNETGVRQPVQEVARVCREREVALVCDASQSAGKIPLNVETLGADAVAVSAHKFHGPKGVGALFLRPGLAFHSPLRGGGHQRGRRGGTENVAGIVGLGTAATLAQHHLTQQTYSRVAALRDHLQAGLAELAPDARFNSADAPRLPTTLSVSFPGVHAEALAQQLDDHHICVAPGAACHTGAGTPNETLVAMRIPETHIRGTLRFSLGRTTKETEINTVLTRLPTILAQARSNV